MDARERARNLMIDGKRFTAHFEIDGKSVGWKIDYFLDNPEVTAQMIVDSISDLILAQLEGDWPSRP